MPTCVGCAHEFEELPVSLELWAAQKEKWAMGGQWGFCRTCAGHLGRLVRRFRVPISERITLARAERPEPTAEVSPSMEVPEGVKW